MRTCRNNVAINVLGLILLAISNFSCSTIGVSNESNCYYFDAVNGDDQNTGLTPEKAWRSLEKIATIDLEPGDQILLADGQVFKQGIELKDIHGSADHPIRISSYGTQTGKSYAYINTTGLAQGILLDDCSFIEIDNLSISAGAGVDSEVRKKGQMRCGVLIKSSKPGFYQHLYLRKLIVKDVFYEKEGFTRPKGEVKTANGTQCYGWGIRVINKTQGAFFKDIRIDSCRIKNVAHTGIKFTSSKRENKVYGISDFTISGNEVLRTGGPGMQFSGVQNGSISNNLISYSGSNDDSRKWGRGSGLWTWSSDRVMIEKNRFENANGPGDSAGAHVDFNCSNIVLQYNFSVNNAGGFCEILGNNYNCCYRYNISVNDGYRVKGENGAFQEGKIFWLSAYCSGKRRGPYNSYFYNNTIYVDDTIDAKIAIDRLADGILIANNIFHIKGKSLQVKGDQYRPETNGKYQDTDILFRNNLFLFESSWPEELRFQDENPIYGDAKFTNPGGLKIEDYMPQDFSMVSDKGIAIARLSGDSVGIVYGLKMKTDILGNSIKDLPDMGAIEFVNE
ncbi:right-handed parallel beta-helix repeat-containing protein [Puteibacter caeruleilacunae]|nr:right-handed parallel beta-helix repeat-containing protein [Puteibacter caeruleilacunae]